MTELQEIIDKLTPKNIIEIVLDLGADRYEERNEYVLFPTICHNLDSTQAKLKLCYYYNTHSFTCFTDCGESFNIFTLIDKRFTLCGRERVKSYKDKLKDTDYTFYDIVQYVLNHSKISITIREEQVYQSIASKYLKREMPTLPIFSNKVLATFDNIAPVEWLQEGITRDALKTYNVKYSVSRNCAVIPHYDINGNLVGIRERNFDENRIERLGKYRPMRIEGVSYAHQLSANLYGLNIAQRAIKKTHKVIIFEGEKSVQKMYSILGDRNIAVATCGSHINKYQVRLLMRNFDLNEIIIAFDKEYETRQELIEYSKKIKEMCRRYLGYCDFSFIRDKDNLLELKDAPIDKGWDIFNKLFNERIRVNEI